MVFVIGYILIVKDCRAIMLEEKSVVNKIEILEDGLILVRKALRIYKNGSLIAESYHSYNLAPGQNITNEDVQVKAHASVAWTSEVIKNYQDKWRK